MALRKLFDTLRRIGSNSSNEINLDEWDISPEPLHFGSQRAVTKAVHRKTGRVVALKHISPRLGTDAEKRKAAAESLEREAAIGKELDHPNVVKTYGLKKYGGIEYLVLEYLPDGSLLDVIRRRESYSLPELLGYCKQIARGLAYLHSIGVVHRDLKSSNILRDGDRFVLTDFGLSAAPGVRGIKEAPPRSGTPKFMSPEQTRGWTLAPTSDIYSIGIVFYEMFVGEQEITPEEAIQRSHRTLTYHFVPPIEKNPQLPEGLNELLMRCLHNSRKIRFQNGHALLRALNELGQLEYKSF